MKSQNEKFLQRKKFFMVLPLLVLPFITMIFWALGGGKGSAIQAMPIAKTGLNTDLPHAQFKEEETWDKFALYESAARDSAEYETARENDPYFDLVAFQSQDSSGKKATDQSKLIGTFKHKDRLTASDANEEKVNSKLEQLYQEINRASKPVTIKYDETIGHTPDVQFSEDVSKLESMMEMMHEEQSEEDPEMKQINDMLEKIMDVQHPERVRERLNQKEKEHKSNTFSVEPVSDNESISLLGASGNTMTKPFSDSTTATVSEVVVVQNGFYGLDETYETQVQGNAIEAIIHDTQELVVGATVRMRLLNDVSINDQVIAKDQFIYGACSINGERLIIAITSIRNGNSLLPVSLSVYDLDGLEGIYIPGAITREAAKQASDDALQNVQMFSMDQSVGAQAASAGIEATKGLLSKKAKLIKVTVKAGYKIFLKDTNQE